MSNSSPVPDAGEQSPRFATTRWSIVLSAGRRGTSDASAALETLCETYWYPVYAFIRRRGYSAADAQDAAQEFFATLLEKDYVRAADRELGRFRTFLLTAVSRFLSNQKEREQARKRGGGRKLISIDSSALEQRYLLEPADDWTPERLFERRWALALLDRVLERLGTVYAEQGKVELFERLKCFLTDLGTPATHAEVAAELGLTEGAVKVAVHRLRRRYRELLTSEIAETVSDPAEVGLELDYLLAALRGETS